MPMNHDQDRPSKRWYKLCFIPTIDDSSDDSDTESVVIARRTSTHTSSWEQEQPSPPPSPPNLESQINLLSPPLPLPPPPPPPLLPTLPSLPQLVLQRRSFQPLTSPSPTATTQDRPDNDKTEFLQIPDSVMNAIHMVRITELNLIDELSQCPICMDEFELGDEACQLPCNHTFKFECMLRWLNNSESCPVCRLQLNGFERQGSSYNIGDDDDDDSLDLEPQIQPQVINSLEDHIQFSPHSQVIDDGAGDNSDEAEYDSACDDLNDIWFGNYQSSHSLQI
ncbi:unnamed protein product [Trifolium pratense]|uniref:Uncharacterized protein n=1 Tax=Trifolium pratense TaxID=57577 RepID=A0ACB0JTP8_TRIPR|nr:unnamed protein product [Trifolium pratense]